METKAEAETEAKTDTMTEMEAMETQTNVDGKRRTAMTGRGTFAACYSVKRIHKGCAQE